MDARHRMDAALAEALPALRARRPWRRLADLALAYGLWGAGIAAATAAHLQDGPWWMQAALIGVAAMLGFGGLNALMLLAHEGHHGHLGRANGLLSWIVCVPLLHAPTAYGELHALHHRHLGGPGDPDHYGNYAAGKTLLAMHWLRLLIGPILYLGLIPMMAWRHAPHARLRMLIESACMLPLWIVAAVWVPWQVLLSAWLLPAFGVAIMTAVRGLSQHTLTDASDAWRASRTIEVGPVLGMVLLHENLHLAHHMYPDVPSYHLRALDAHLQRLGPGSERVQGYARFVWRFVRGAV